MFWLHEIYSCPKNTNVSLLLILGNATKCVIFQQHFLGNIPSCLLHKYLRVHQNRFTISILKECKLKGNHQETMETPRMKGWDNKSNFLYQWYKKRAGVAEPLVKCANSLFCLTSRHFFFAHAFYICLEKFHFIRQAGTEVLSGNLPYPYP